MNPLAVQGAEQIARGFDTSLERFAAVTRRARLRFEQRDWAGGQHDALERLGVYPGAIQATLAELKRLLGPRALDRPLWRRMKLDYADAIGRGANAELARTFFNSISRRTFGTIGVDSSIEFVAGEAPDATALLAPAAVRRYDWPDSTLELMRRILRDYRFDARYHDDERDATAAAHRIDSDLQRVAGTTTIEEVELLEPVFFRNKAAYIVGRMRAGGRVLPLVLPLIHPEDGVAIDAVLTDADDVSILFSFTRSHFHVEAERPGELVAFLKSVLPLKPIAELYIALGWNKRGKTELYRDLMAQLERQPEPFETAPGDRGMVMLVFTLPHYDRVFKVLRDVFDYPKQTSPREVRERYRLVFERDRVGRLVEAQEFEYLTFERAWFAKPLLDELLREAKHVVRVADNRLTIEHLYTERKVRPLNLYLRECTGAAAERAVLDYGAAIKELAAANIFAGDFLLKNFGVTRHGRVVFYDYDELCLLTDCNFRHMPRARCDEDEMASEPWFTIGDNDVFPEEFSKFLDLRGPLLDVLRHTHGDLFTVAFWRDLQRRHRRGELMDFFPYPQQRRLRPGTAG